MNKNIFFYWEGKDMPNVYKKNIEFTRATHPDYNVKVVGSDFVLPILSKRYPELAEAFTKIKIPAAKSDIARLAILQEFGGWYLDCDVLLRVSLKYFEDSNKELYLFWRNDKNRFIIQNSILGGKKNHEFFDKALVVISKLLLQKIFKYDVYRTTGPMALGPVASEYINVFAASVEEIDYSKVGLKKDNESKGSWTYQQNCGIIIDDENPPVFIKRGGADRLGSDNAFYFFKEIFEQYPSTKASNYRKLIMSLGLHYLDSNVLCEEVRQIVDEYMNKVEDKKFINEFYKKYNASK